MSKEYTYEIDKYTIGVDENGEDGIGMTVAKIENGEINFLGNCYGENARCIDLLIKENQELKKQYCERTDCSGRIGNSKKVEELQQENKLLKDNWNKLKEDLINNINYWQEQEKEWAKLGFIKFGGEANSKIIFKKVLDKMQELQGSDNK